ncbi:MAG: S-methyl-5-thioribose-1-phosphate isomerase [Thermoprotei archaeon]|nr:MAG: S-methyl-5-thioribose-1-phosphate isomerase [Thermoprotei archaeon]
MLRLPRTIEWVDGRVRLINQLKLPHELEYVETSDWRRVAEAIRRMEIRGAPAIGVAAAFAMALAAVHSRAGSLEEALRELEECARILKSTRPTAVNLPWAVDRVLRAARAAADVEELREMVVRAALEVQRMDEECNRRIGELGEQLIDDGDTVMTICNAGSLATSYYGTATAPIYLAHERGKRVRVIALETRPYLQGARLTAWELKQAGIEVKVVTDNAMGIVMEREGVNLVIVGADRVTRRGYVANKVGTYPLALVAREHGVPFYVAAPTSSFDLSIEGPGEIPIEVRPSEEVVYIYGRRIAPEGVEAIYYAFDVTPPKLITGIITERGILYPPYEKSIRRLLSAA